MSIDPDQGYSYNAKDFQRMEDEAVAAAENYLKKLTSNLKYNDVKIEWEVVTGKAADSIADYAEKSDTNLIAIATHGRSGVSRWVMGSVADKVVRTSVVPVLTVRPQGLEPAPDRN